MKVRTKSGLLTVLLAVVFALTLCAGLWLAMPKSSNNASAEAETGLVPLYGDELKANGSPKVNAAGEGVWWDAGKTQIRLFFKFNGITPPARQDTMGGGGTGAQPNMDHVLVTSGGVTKTVAEWNKGWGAAREKAVNGAQVDQNTFEWWFNANTDADWIHNVTEVTLLAGFQWYNGNTPMDGAVLNKTYVLSLTDNWWTLKSDTEPVGLVPLYGEGITKSNAPAGNALWGENQMRLFFRMSGTTKLADQADLSGATAASQKKAFGNLPTHIEITAGTETKTAAQWIADNKIAWIAPFNGHGLTGTSVYELWLNAGESAENKAWLATVSAITYKAGLEWPLSADQNVAGVVCPKDYKLTLDGNKIWQLDSATDAEPVAPGMYPIYGDELLYNAAYRTSMNGKGIYWADSHAPIRLFFKFEGMAQPTRQDIIGGDATYVSPNADKILLTTTSGETKTFTQFAPGWLGPRETAVNGPDGKAADPYVYELWLNGGEDLMASIEKVTLKAGFQWYIGKENTPVPGSELDRDYTLKIEDNCWVLESMGDPVKPDEKSITPLGVDEITGHFLNSNNEPQGAPKVFWDASPSQMRFYFKLNGVTAPDDSKGQNIYNGEENILLTTKEGETHSVKDWATVMGAYWLDNSRSGPIDGEYHEVWLWTQNHDWFNSLGYVTIKAGFRLKANASTPIDGAVVKETVYLKINENGQYEKCTEQDIPKQPEQEVTFSPLTAAEAQGHFKVSGDTNAPYAGKLGSYWGITQMRFYFKATGLNLTGVDPGQKVYNQSDKILLTDANNDTKSVKEWGSDKIAWIDFWVTANSGVTEIGYGEIDFCIAQGTGQPGDHLYDTNTVWLAGIKKVTFKAGFEWLTAANTPLEGATLKEDVVLWNGGIEAGWQRYADSITATLKDGEIPQGASLEDYLTVKAKYGTEEEAVTGYTLEGYDNTKGGVAQTVTVKYQDKETTVSVTLQAPDKTLTDIELSGKTTFNVPRFDELNTKGLIVKAKFSDGSEQMLEAGQYTVQEFDPWTAAKSVTLKVSYTFAGKTCEKNITVNVDAPDTTKGLRVAYDNGMKTKMQEGHMYLFFTVDGVADPTNAITGKSARMASPEPRLHAWEYLIIDGKPATEWNSEGKLSWITVWGDTENGIFRILLNSSTDVTWVDNIKTITIKAGFSLWYCADGKDHHNDAAASAYQNWEGAVVKEDVVIYNGMEKGWQKGVASISATYTGGAITVGEHIDKSKLTVTAIYYDNSQPAAVTDYTLDESQLNTVGDKTVTVTYQDKTTTFTVNVKAAGKSVRDITLSGTSVSVKQFEKPDFSNIKVNVNYSDSTNASVGLDDQRVTLSAYDTETMGNKQITVTYTEFGQSLQKTLTLKVEKPDLTKGLEVFWLSGENTYWLNDDGSSTQLRLHLKMKDGSELPQVGAADIGTAYNAAQHLKDYILINGQPYSAWSSRIAWIAPYEAIQNMIDDQAYEIIICVGEGDADKEWLKGIHTVTLKAGFRWFNASGDVEGAILKEDMILWNAGEEGWEKKATSIEASTTQKNPPIGAKVDLTKITGTITYFDGTKIPLTEKEKYTIDITTFENEGSETVTITYQDVTFGLTYIVSNEKITGIKVTHDPIKTLYRFGTLSLDTRGIEVVKLFEGEEADPKNAIDINDLTFEGYDPYCMEEKQVITVRYGNFTDTFEIKMEPLENGIEIDWGMSSFDTQINVEGLTVVILSPAEKELNPVKVPFDAPGVIDKLKINGKPAQEYVEKGVIDWVGFYTWRFVIALNTPDLVWGTESNGSHSAGKSYYEEGRSELIRTVELLPGFQVYTTRDGADHWDEAASMKYARAVEGSALTHNVLLYNADGHGWDRVLKQGAGANLDGSSADFKLVPAEDAITLKSSGKVTYKKGESISVRGFVFTLQFEDGGTEDRALSPIQIDTDTYDPDTLGEQNVKIEISGGVYYLKVTVTEDGQGGEQPGDQPGGEQPGEQGGEEKGGCGGILGVNALMLMCGGCALALLRRRKK